MCRKEGPDQRGERPPIQLCRSRGQFGKTVLVELDHDLGLLCLSLDGFTVLIERRVSFCSTCQMATVANRALTH